MTCLICWWFCLHLHFSWSSIKFIQQIRDPSVDFWWAPIRVPYSDWFHLQIRSFVDSELHVRTCLLRAFNIPSCTLSVRKIWGHEPSAWWDCKIKPDVCLINRELKSLNALWDVWLSDCILNQYEELTLGFLSASWWTQDWWSDINLCTENAVNECFNRLIQSRCPSLREAFWLVCHDEVELSLAKSSSGWSWAWIHGCCNQRDGKA